MIRGRATRALTVADIMSTQVLTVGRSAAIAEAAALMVERRVGSILVIDGLLKRPIGILTERDLVRFGASGANASATMVVEYMTPEPDTIQPDEEAIEGANVIDGYDGKPEANAAGFTNGWFRTGDLGVIDAAGYLTLVGRLKEMINRAGEKIAPHEVDEVLLQHPTVAEAVCFGVPHPRWGEEVRAVVVLRGRGEVTERQLIRHCQEHLAEFKIPKRLHFVEAIPRGATGKVQRNRIRTLMGLA
jgi:acyl-CoA synthetase (AMP-forming)/AMP-acid ligase II